MKSRAWEGNREKRERGKGGRRSANRTKNRDGQRERRATDFVGENDSRDALRVPEELVDVVVPDDVLVILLPLEKLALDDLVPLISDEPVERLDDRPEVETLWHRLDPVLALGRSVVVVGALEDEAEALRNESDLGGLTPTEKEERDLPEPVVLAHVVHGGPPSVDSAVERLLRGSRRTLGFLLPAGDRLDSGEAGVLGGSDSVIEIELGGEVPLSVVGVLSTDVVGVKGEERLVGRHSRRSRVELDHEEVENVSRGI
jgi:hypothetical protein